MKKPHLKKFFKGSPRDLLKDYTQIIDIDDLVAEALCCLTQPRLKGLFTYFCSDRSCHQVALVVQPHRCGILVGNLAVGLDDRLVEAACRLVEVGKFDLVLAQVQKPELGTDEVFQDSHPGKFERVWPEFPVAPFEVAHRQVLGHPLGEPVLCV